VCIKVGSKKYPIEQLVYNSNSAADQIYSTDETGLCLTMSAK